MSSARQRWRFVLVARYPLSLHGEQSLECAGATHGALPMMQMFHFVFEAAKASIQQTCVSIKAKVQL
ncbi:hypothetical protein [Pseudomonas sp. Marseille-P9899]|uniref:hypothetical protein n=1 Tax=Pseudomonas sp. Marseille-P9899 TaxID=2730401 RepID=UPI001589F0B0|nr:hypothetical protein [Pseudomonas sp. Marseille-P9899]